ncbi:YibE/F family protein [Arthrobacter sp. AETb3-4]|uniref:YibE/F family protein n=1 Tax=Arthrobacter wenxiniae TaxID=2713570 RepID=A0A7Y7IGC4_9MICC|nr:YibE/F family protein [Arthrobacter wenxiniae]
MDFVRTLPIGLLALVYAIVVVAVARWRGLRAMVGLGGFNDVTITQSSAVWELYELAPDTSARAPFTSAMRIGRDHIASTVHTIAFAYAGSALPGLILVSLHDRSLLEPLASSELAEEVVHILVGPIGLVPAIPVTTAVAVARVKATGRGAQPQPA